MTDRIPHPSSSCRKAIILFHVSTILYWGAVYIYMPILSPYAKQMSGSLQAAGVVMGAYGLAQVLFRVPIGVLSDRLKKRKPFVYLGFIFDLISALGLAFSGTTVTLFLSFFAAGIAASMWVAFTILFSSYYPMGQVARSISFLLFTTRLAMMLGNYFGGMIAETWGWTAPFCAGAVFSIIGFFLAIGVPEQSFESKTQLSFQKLLRVGRERKLLTVSLLGILLQFSSFSAVYGFAPIYAQQIGASKGDLGLLLLAFMLPSTLTMLFLGVYIRFWFQERTLLVAGFLLISGPTLSISLAPSLGILYVLQVVNGVGAGILLPHLMSLAIQPIPQEKQATAMGFYQGLYTVGMGLGPILSGIFGEHFGLPSVFIFCGTLSFLGAFISWKSFPMAS